MPTPKIGRPKAEKRIALTGLVLPSTRKAIEKAARAQGVSRGRIIDQLVSQNPQP